MKNLYQRLRPQDITALNDFSTRYPHTVEAVRVDLERNFSITQMTFHTAMTLNDLLNSRGPVDFMALSDHFEMPEL